MNRKKMINRIYHLLCGIFFILVLLVTGKTVVKAETQASQVNKKLPVYHVTFNNNNGTSTCTAYTNMTQSACKGDVITLPTVPNTSVYETVGWTTSKGQDTPLYKCGSSYQVKGNTAFYLVRKKIVYHTVQFYYQTGAANTAFKALTKKVASGSTITFPANPSKTNYVGMGWSLKKNASTASYAVGKSYRVTKDLVFYAVYKPGIRLFYYSSNGSTLYQTVTVARGQSVTLSGVKNPSGCTMLGWSTQKGKTTSPDYLVGSTFTVSKTTKLYAVMFRHSQETKLSDSDFPDVSTTYSKVIFVGDSRTYQLSETLKAQCSPLVYDGVSFVCKSSSKLDWLQTKGYSRLMQEIGDGGTDDKPIAVIFNHGINDLGDVSSYITYMKKIAPKLQKLHCRLFYMSVNPCNNATLLDRKDTASRPEAAVRSFNAAIRTSLCSSGLFTYINTYSMLTNTGYSMNSGSGYDDGYDDGLHYTTVTSKRIYAYCLKTILAL